MPIKIERATPNDAEALTRMAHLAFKDDAFQLATIHLTGANDAQANDYWNWRVGRLGARLVKPGSHYYKAVETETGQIVGFTGIFEPSSSESTDTESTQDEQSWPEIVDVAAFQDFDSELIAAKKALMGERADLWYLASMAVHPDHQRKGIAQALLRVVLDLVDISGSDAYLAAMPAAVRLYQSAGFETIGAVTQTLVQRDVPIMLRRPQPL